MFWSFWEFLNYWWYIGNFLFFLFAGRERCSAYLFSFRSHWRGDYDVCGCIPRSRQVSFLLLWLQIFWMLLSFLLVHCANIRIHFLFIQKQIIHYDIFVVSSCVGWWLVIDNWKFSFIAIIFIAFMLVSLNLCLENRSLVNGILD